MEQVKAFPNNRSEGMELRDYFAAKALPLAMSWLERNYDRSIGTQWMWDEAKHENDALDIADISYHIADAMMKKREERDG
jgi:hypothetical protein